MRTILAKIARQDPGLVLETIERLPETKSQYFVESLDFQMESIGRKRLVWKACNYWATDAQSAQNAFAFLAEQNIDPQEMNRLGRDAD